jgi:hypothetical protein
VAGGLVVYFAVTAFTFVEMGRAYGALPTPRPDYGRVRRDLVHDAFHARA